MTTNKKYYSKHFCHNRLNPCYSRESGNPDAIKINWIPDQIGQGTKKYLSNLKIFFFLFLTDIFLLPVFCSAKVVINEIMIGQTGAANNEFIELYNPTENNIDLKGYALKKKTKSGTETNLVSKFPEGIISAHGYFLIAHPNYKDTVNANISYSGTSYYISGDNTIILYDQEKNIIDKVGFGEATDFENQPAPKLENNNQSIERQPIGQDTDNNNVDFIIRDTPTPQNSGNQPPAEEETETTESESQSVPIASNYPPYAEAGPDIAALTNQKIVFDGSKSWDPDWDDLIFFWNFGDGATDTLSTTTHSYLYPGQYIATLTVGDGQFSDIDTLTVNVYDNSVIISEFFPEQGWVELFNQSGQIANLSSWRLNNFVFPENSLIAPKQYLILTQETIQLEPAGQINLIYPDGTIACRIEYEENNPGQTMAFDGQEYFWTKLATPGAMNIISAADLEIKNSLATNILSVQEKPTEEKINLKQKDVFSVKTAETETETENKKPEENKYIASLSQSTVTSNQKDKLILILSIIISASLFLIWGIIILKRKTFN